MASLPEGLPSLNALVEQARAPDAARPQVDALIAGLAQPPPPEHLLRERADLLLSIIGDGRMADFTGSNGRTVRRAAVDALIALGYPYALELPPEALEGAAAEADTPSFFASSKGRWGLGLVVLLGVLQSVGALWLGDGLKIPDSFMLIVLALIAGTTFAPAGLTVLGHSINSKATKAIGTVWQVLSALCWIIPGFFLMSAALLSVMAFAIGCTLLVGALLMNSDS